jgi:hypothetical protein
MKKLYAYLLLFLGFLLHFIPGEVLAQPCSSLQFTTLSYESRCTATGSVAVTTTGGSGSYNYKAAGPLTTPFTSASTITGLRPGFYRITVKDINTNCEISTDSVEVKGTYSDPRFALAKTNVSCFGNDGTITVNNVQFGRDPFTYTIIAPSPASVGVTNSSGAFANLTAGEYFIQLRDSCGGIQVRRAVVEQYSWWFDGIAVTRVGCDSADAVINVKDNWGNSNTSGPAFSGFMYGVVRSAGDTTWYATRTFRFYLGNRRNITIVAKDACGVIHTSAWNFPPSVLPAAGPVALTNFACTTFMANVTGGQNLTAPEYCLYSATNVLLECNYTGYFGPRAYGSYCIRVKDVCYDTTITRCFVATQPVPSVGATVGVSNQVCATFTATINAQTNLTTPEFCLYDSANVLIRCNTTGVFSNLPYGTYCIRTDDNCVDTIITRCLTATRPVPVLNLPVISGSTCGSFTVSNSGSGLITPVYCLYDSVGNIVACNSSGTFTGLPHGNYCIKAISCGDTTVPRCFRTAPPTPAVAATVQVSNKTCTAFSAAITGQINIIAPQYCLFTAGNVQIGCNTTGVFNNIPYGSYCIRVKDSCTDSTIIRCFTEARALPSLASTMQQTNSACSTFSARVTGVNLTAPQYCLYNDVGALVRCNTTGIFDSLAYGHYCARVVDACGDTLMVCQTFTATRGITLTSSKSCSVGKANINVNFLSGNAPYIVRILHPGGATVFVDTSMVSPVQAVLPALPAGLSYKIIGKDACGQPDTSSIIPDASMVTRTINAVSKCPSSVWANGSGDLSVTCNSNFYTVLPVIIQKNGSAYARNYSSNSGSNYLFNDLEPATYIVEYTMATCNVKMYDTVAVQPYSYPSQGQSAVYQCDNNSFSLGANVSGGVSPYTYQIIGSMPDTPTIISSSQTNPIFTINNGTTYSLVRLRTIDACGNATLSDLSVLPLQNISITASDLCYYDTVTLSVDRIANATYEWYKRRTAADSTLVCTTPVYEIPFFEPEHTATYVCKVMVNNGCLIRLTYFNLAQNCVTTVLPVPVLLTGKKDGETNRLTWNVSVDKDIKTYVVEHKSEGAATYQWLGNVERKITGDVLYWFTDGKPAGGINLYRLKMIYTNGTAGYSNTVRLQNDTYQTSVYPNPVNEVVYFSIRGKTASDYDIVLTNAGGQVVHTATLKNIMQTTLPYKRNGAHAGLYLLYIKNRSTGRVEYHKILFR